MPQRPGSVAANDLVLGMAETSRLLDKRRMDAKKDASLGSKRAAVSLAASPESYQQQSCKAAAFSIDQPASSTSCIWHQHLVEPKTQQPTTNLVTRCEPGQGIGLPLGLPQA